MKALALLLFTVAMACGCSVPSQEREIWMTLYREEVKAKLDVERELRALREWTNQNPPIPAREKRALEQRLEDVELDVNGLKDRERDIVRRPFGIPEWLFPQSYKPDPGQYD